jgi:superfamily I DNA and/or RNA helicase
MKKSKRDDFNKITVDNFDELKDYFYFKRNFEKFKSYDNNELSNATAAILSTIKKQKNTVSDKINHFAKENSKIFQQNTKNKAGIYHQLNLQRRKSINFCVTNYKDEIVAGFKCIVTTPELASRFFRHFNFDYVIFDEASQMTKERLFPCLFLGKCKIICGDQKQLPPTSFFSNKFDNEYEETDEQILNEENFITFCDTFENIQNFMLTNHYRSKYSELIEFCNRKIYDGKLNYMNKNAPNDDCIEDCHITNGIWNNGVNEAEANKIVEIVKKICSEENHGTIGIITFNITQKELIFDKLQKCNDKKINEEFLRKNQEGENVSLFVKNLENVQGDERDIIIFSIAFARNLEGKFLQNFGPINAIGGVNRLNVAFSRAKEKMIIVNSINNTEITTENAVNKGRMFFKNFMKYVQSKPHEIDDVVQSNRKHSPESVFEEEVLISLRQYFPHLNFIPQYNCGEYRIDIVVMSDDTPLLAIECDGYRYHSSLDKMREDNERQKDLESVG